MQKGKKINKNEILNDYTMLEGVAADLKLHQKYLHEINKRIAKNAKTDMRYGLLENLAIVMEHMKKAEKEVNLAKKKLKMI